MSNQTAFASVPVDSLFNVVINQQESKTDKEQVEWMKKWFVKDAQWAHKNNPDLVLTYNTVVDTIFLIGCYEDYMCDQIIYISSLKQLVGFGLDGTLRRLDYDYWNADICKERTFECKWLREWNVDSIAKYGYSVPGKTLETNHISNNLDNKYTKLVVRIIANKNKYTIEYIRYWDVLHIWYKYLDRKKIGSYYK